MIDNQAFRAALQGSLLFSSSLMRGSALHWPAQGPGLRGGHPSSPSTNSGVCEVDFDMSLAQPQASRNERRGLLQDKGWKKNNMLSMFTRAYVPPEVRRQ